MKKLFIFTDGGSRGNPGPAGVGVVFKDEKGKTVKKLKKFIGRATNNQAEYQALILALTEIKSNFVKVQEIEINLDSQLIKEQVIGNFKIKNENIGPLFIKVHNLMTEIGKKISFNLIPRLENMEADRLVNEALDEGTR